MKAYCVMVRVGPEEKFTKQPYQPLIFIYLVQQAKKAALSCLPVTN